MGRIATIIIGGQEVTVLNYETDQPIILSSSDEEGMNGGDSDCNLSDDGDWRPKGVSGKKASSKSLNSMNIGNGNQTKRNLFKNADSGIGSDGNSAPSSRSSSSEEAIMKTEECKPEISYKQNTALSRAARAQARNEKEFERLKQLAKGVNDQFTPMKSTTRSPKTLPRIKPMSRPTSKDEHKVLSPMSTPKKENVNVLKESTETKKELKLEPKLESKQERKDQVTNEIEECELDEEDLQDWKQDVVDPSYKCDTYEDNCSFSCFEREEFQRHVDTVHLGMDIEQTSVQDDGGIPMDDLPLC